MLALTGCSLSAKLLLAPLLLLCQLHSCDNQHGSDQQRTAKAAAGAPSGSSQGTCQPHALGACKASSNLRRCYHAPAAIKPEGAVILTLHLCCGDHEDPHPSGKAQAA